MPDSITNNLLKNHLLSTNGMTEHYNELIRVEKYNKMNIIKHGIAYIGYGILSKRGVSRVLHESNCKALSNALFIPGLLYYLWLLKMKRKIDNSSR